MLAPCKLSFASCRSSTRAHRHRTVAPCAAVATLDQSAASASPRGRAGRCRSAVRRRCAAPAGPPSGFRHAKPGRRSLTSSGARAEAATPQVPCD
eukprot:2596897-Prymnesium_polylepis.1